MITFRFGVLLKLQEAQKVRVSSLKTKTVTSDRELHQANFRSRLDKFSGLHARIVTWAEHLLQRLEEGLCQLDIGDKQLLYEETLAEVTNQQKQITENSQDGKALLRGNNMNITINL